MTAETTPAQPVSSPAPEPVAADTRPVNVTEAVSDAVMQALTAERQRAAEIRTMAAPFVAGGQLQAADVDRLIDEGTPVVAASQALLATMAAAAPSAPRREAAVIRRDEVDTRREGMIQALMGRTDGPAEQFRGLRIRSLALELAGPQRGFNDHESIRRGMTATTMMGGAHGVSDFAGITTEVMNRSLIDAYTRRAASWQVVCGTPLSASDFRELAPVGFGGDFQLKPVTSNGEYEQAVLADRVEGLKVERRGRTIKLTFEAVVNDDMGAFARIPSDFAMAARIMESSMVWSLIRGNAVLKSDNTALFHATHGNIVAPGAAIDVASVGAMRALMWQQRPHGSTDADDFLQLEASHVLVPPALETKARQFITAITPAKIGDANPYSASLTAVTVPNLGAAAGGSDVMWYMVSADLPPVTHAYLEGYQSPTVETVEGLNPDVVTMNARHIFGAAVTEFRGIARNAGQ